MKKIITLCVVALATLSLQAQTLRIGENNSKMDYAPVYSTWADKYYCSQIIYNATELTAMQGKEITKLAFFLKAAIGNNKDYEHVEIRLMSVSYDVFSSTSYESIDNAVLVFNGTLPASTQTELEVTLENPYLYESGNLLVDVRKTENGGGYAPSTDKNAGRFQSSFNEGYYTVLYGYSSSSVPTSGTQSGNRPDIKFTYQTHVEITCIKPGKPAVTAVDAASAAFAWAAGDAESQWQVVLAKGEAAANWSQAQLVNEAKAELAVEANTDYTCYVRAYCDENNQSDAASVSFHTPCLPMATLPYVEDFELTEEGDYAEGSHLGCWELFMAGDYPTINKASGLANGGEHYLRFYGAVDTKQMAVLPAFEKPINELQISFWNNSLIEFEGASTIEIGYLTNANDSASFVSCKTLDKYTSYTKVTHAFKDAPAEAKRIALRYANGTATYPTSSYVDDLRVEEISAATALENVQDAGHAAKRIVNGQLIIEHNGIRYNALGTEIK